MIRRLFKRSRLHEKYEHIIVKYKIPRAFLSINRRSVARGVLVGLFIAFIPIPTQMLTIVLLQPLFRFNLPLALALVWVTNPVTMPFIYYVEYQTGVLLLGMHNLPTVTMNLAWFEENIHAIMLPLYTGAFVYSAIFGIAGYFTVQYLWIRSVRKERRADLRSRRS